MMKAIAFMWAALRWVGKRILSPITRNESSLEAAGYRVGTLQGMSRRYEILLFEAHVADLESLAKAGLPVPESSKLSALPQTILYDWVAQAIMICALHGLHESTIDKQQLIDTWLRALRAVGVRTASDLHEVAYDKGRLLRALTAAQSAIEHQEKTEGDGDASSSASTFMQENLDKLLETINENTRWKSNINEIERLLRATVNSSAQQGEN
jgi:hypothetical protein